jgi:hypothetical protein
VPSINNSKKFIQGGIQLGRVGGYPGGEASYFQVSDVKWSRLDYFLNFLFTNLWKRHILRLQMNSKEQRSVEQLYRFFTALGRHDVQIRPQKPPHPDVLVEIDTKRIAVETTDYHGDEANRGGSALRRQEEQHAAAGEITGSYGPLDPTPGLVKRINEKVPKSYDLTNVDELWLVIFSSVPQIGAFTSTFLIPQALDCNKLSEKTGSSLEKSQFDCCHIFCFSAHNGPRLYSWKRGDHWRDTSHSLVVKQI